jgi:hypothetical protein
VSGSRVSPGSLPVELSGCRRTMGSQVVDKQRLELTIRYSSHYRSKHADVIDLWDGTGLGKSSEYGLL